MCEGARETLFDVCGALSKLGGMPSYFPDLEEFRRVVAGGAQVIPVWRQLLADRLTPVTGFELLGVAEDAFLLEGGVGIEKKRRCGFFAALPSFGYRAEVGRGGVSGAGADGQGGGEKTE